MIENVEDISDSALQNELNRRVNDSTKKITELINRLDFADVYSIYNLLKSDISRKLFEKLLYDKVHEPTYEPISDWKGRDNK